MLSVIQSLKAQNLSELGIAIDKNSESNELIAELVSHNVFPIIDFKNEPQYTLTFKDNKLGFLFEKQKLITVDFLDRSIFDYAKKNSKKSLFSKALGLGKDNKTLLDLTPGFGKDAFVAAKFFDEVILVERNPLMYILLQDGLRRFADKYPLIAPKFKLILDDSYLFLEEQKSLENISVYFDFMFIDKKSKSNKQMLFLDYITKVDSQRDQMLYIDKALNLNAKRIVLKAKKINPDVKFKLVFEGSTVNYYVF